MTDEEAAKQLQEWAAARFDRLTPAEVKLLEKVPTGDGCDVSSGDEKKDDPATADNWGDDRIVRAAVIRWLCVDQDASKLVDAKGVQLKGARIDGTLDLQDAKISFGLLFWKCRIREPMYLHGADVSRVELSESHTGSITMDGIIVHHDVFLRYNFKAQGEVRLLGASVGGDLNCSGGTFENKGEIALCADGVTVKGSVFLNAGFTAQGEVRLPAASIGVDLDCGGGTFENEGENALSAETMTVKGRLFLRHGFSVSGNVDLEGASVGVLVDEEKAWPDSCRKKLYLDGFQYGTISAAAPTDAAFRIRWLELQDQEKEGFLPKPYVQLAKVLREMGHPSDAKTVLIAMEKARRKYGGMSWWRWLGHGVLGATIGYGYRTERAGYILAFLLVLGAVFFSRGGDHRIMWPTDRSAIANHDAGEDGVAVKPHYQTFNALLFSADALIPLVDLHQQKYWLPDGCAKRPWGMVLRWYLWFHIAAGWFLSTMVVIGVTGLARPG